MSTDETTSMTAVPTRWVGPIRITGEVVDTAIDVPLATYESPLWPSVGRGAKISRLCGNGIEATITDDRMTRSVIVEATTAGHALRTVEQLTRNRQTLDQVVSDTSTHTTLIDIHHEIVGTLIFLRFAFSTGDASGHNMATLAAERLLSAILEGDPTLLYASISGNYCTDKKVSAVNGILGRGKSVVTEILIPHHIVEQHLHTTAERIARLNVRKNLIGSTLAGSLRSANAHYANMLLAFYLATGQDAANIVEGSQGITHAEVRDDGLYFSCNLPNIIIGTVGNGKASPTVTDNLTRLGCNPDPNAVGESARKLAVYAAATTLCGELSLLAAQTNPGELMSTHLTMERRAETAT